ncbi:hypothetical membrane protein [Thermoplasma acidophilum]|uniref:Hypothetical membrane protein n=1 Tax=Thermoplasma acidophilum (strain ATCC 25905 / DSM 1728 / JCM 9062 / NBRC 15155 / AMRC-C165) TaxID=273075 RepID=Q9HI44_THEAC|nr:MarR family transcriptional regulator [Thermoplasma acidophilum]CAC12621.1 hypothetical membrane protein [Thermoplasma acidophilum]
MKKSVDGRFDSAERQKALRMAIFYGISLLLSLLIIVVSITFFIMVIYLEGKVSSQFLYIFISIIIANLAISGLSVRGLMSLYVFLQSERTDQRTIVLSKSPESHGTANDHLASKVNPDYFTDLELEIIDALKGHGNRMLQSEMARSISASKASISRALTSLENKGIIVRMRKGVTNEIILIETGFR